MRLTVDLILGAQVSINPLRERELSLRGYKAPAIENLGVTKDAFDCIDLSDNEIKKLENFPRLNRLRMLLLNNNYVTRFQDDLADSITNLEYLILTGNKVSQLGEIDRLVCLQKLDTLSLCGNPVTKQKFYREYVINKLPQLRVLDFKKVKPAERDAASLLFNSHAGKIIDRDLYTGAAAINSVSFIHAGEDHLEHTQTIHSDAAQLSPKSSNQANSDPAKEFNKEEDVDMTNPTDQIPVDLMTVSMLREELKRRGLPTKGLKAELAQRLKHATSL